VLVLCLVTALRYLRTFLGVSIVLFAHAIFLFWLFLVNLGAALGV
jgi:hypothetical protein